MKNKSFIKNTILGLLVGALLFTTTADVVSASVYVSGYTRKDGTYVSGHYRSSPDGNPYNNWSYPGNTNPYTGKTATGNSSTYLDNYYNRSSGSSGSTLGLSSSLGFNNYQVPSIVSEEFKKTYQRPPTFKESKYWKNRARTDKQTLDALQNTMSYWYSRQQALLAATRNRLVPVGGRVSGATYLIPRINTIFRSVYGHNPTPSENRYWLSRISSKPTEQAMRGAMAFHKANNISH